MAFAPPTLLLCQDALFREKLSVLSNVETFSFQEHPGFPLLLADVKTRRDLLRMYKRLWRRLAMKRNSVLRSRGTGVAEPERGPKGRNVADTSERWPKPNLQLSEFLNNGNCYL